MSKGKLERIFTRLNFLLDPAYGVSEKELKEVRQKISELKKLSK